MRGTVALTLCGAVLLLTACSASRPASTDSEPTAEASLGVLDTTTTRAGTVREVLTELQSAIPNAITGYTECVATTSEYPKPFELPCHPYSGSRDQVPAYGLRNLLNYVATGEPDALALAPDDACAAALTESNSDTHSGWALQRAVTALDDAFVVGYPEIDTRLQTVTDLLSSKSGLVAAVLAAC